MIKTPDPHGADKLHHTTGRHPRRRHSALDYQPPVEFERLHTAALPAA